MSDKHIIIEAVIPATGDMAEDMPIMAAIHEAVTALKKAVHGLDKPGTVEVRHRVRKAKAE